MFIDGTDAVTITAVEKVFDAFLGVLGNDEVYVAIIPSVGVINFDFLFLASEDRCGVVDISGEDDFDFVFPVVEKIVTDGFGLLADILVIDEIPEVEPVVVDVELVVLIEEDKLRFRYTAEEDPFVIPVVIVADRFKLLSNIVEAIVDNKVVPEVKSLVELGVKFAIIIEDSKLEFGYTGEEGIFILPEVKKVVVDKALEFNSAFVGVVPTVVADDLETKLGLELSECETFDNVPEDVETSVLKYQKEIE